MIDTYTRLLEATAELEDKKAADSAVTKLIMHLKSMGRMKLLPQIARELKKVASRRLALESFLQVASEQEKNAALLSAKKEGLSVQHVSVEPSLIRGWRLRNRGLLYDRSAKAALVRIYQNVIS